MSQPGKRETENGKRTRARLRILSFPVSRFPFIDSEGRPC